MKTRYSVRANLAPKRVLSMDFFDGFIFRFLQEISAREGETDSGLGNYYAFRLKNHVGGLQDYEGAVFRYLTKTLPNCRCVVHVGMGIGTTTALLAASGHCVVGIEWDAKRVGLAKRLRQATMAVWPEVEERYQLVGGAYPDVMADLSEAQGSNCVLLFTNFAATRSFETRDAVIATFPRFGNVVLDLRTFCDTLEDEVQRRELHDLIVAAGMKAVSPIPTSSGNYYFHFTR